MNLGDFREDYRRGALDLNGRLQRVRAHHHQAHATHSAPSAAACSRRSHTVADGRYTKQIEASESEKSV